MRATQAEEAHVAPTAGVETSDEATEPVEATVEEPVVDEPVAGDDVDTQEDGTGPVDEPEVADEAVTDEEPVDDDAGAAVTRRAIKRPPATGGSWVACPGS